MKYCCGCISLKAWTIIQAVQNLLSSVIGIVIMVLFMTSIVRKNFVSVSDSSLDHPMTDGGIQVDKVADNKWESSEINLIAYYVFVCIFILLILMGLTSILMIVGAVNRVSRYIIPWLSLTFAINVYTFCTSVGIAITTVYISNHLLILLIPIGAALGISLNFYFWLAVYSFYKELVGVEMSKRPISRVGKVITQSPNRVRHNP